MKQIKLLIGISLIAGFALISSCSEDDGVAAKTKTDLLTQHTWIYSTGTSSNPLAGALLAILAGSEYTFKADKTYTGTILAIPTSGDWSFESNESKLIIDDTEYDLSRLDDSTLELIQTDAGTVNTLVYVKK